MCYTHFVGDTRNLHYVQMYDFVGFGHLHFVESGCGLYSYKLQTNNLNFCLLLIALALIL